MSLFTGLSGLISMLFLPGWSSAQPPGAAGDSLATVLLASLVTVSAAFAVARLWPRARK